MLSKKRLAKNGLFNILNGVGAFAIALFLPRILIPNLGKIEYGILALVVNLSAYIAFFSLGIQTAIAKYVAQTEASRDFIAQEEYLNSGAIIIIGSSIAGMVFTAVASWVMPKYMLPHNTNYKIVENFIVSILCFGVITSISLMYNIYAGYFIGVLRNHFSSLTQFLLKLIVLALVYYMVSFLNIHNIVLIVVLIAMGNLLALPILAYNFHCVTKKMNIKIICFRVYSIEKLKQILRFCLELSTWNLAMLLVSSSSLYIVGYFDFNHVTEFSLAVLLVNVIIGVLSAVSVPLMPYFSGLFEQRNENIKLIIVKLTVITIIGSAIFILLYLFFGQFIVKLLFGAKLALSVYSLSLILVLSFAIRNVFLPLSIFLVSSSQQFLGIKMALLEGIINLIASVVLGFFYAAKGVALGSLFGSICGVIFCFISVVPRVKYYND